MSTLTSLEWAATLSEGAHNNAPRSTPRNLAVNRAARRLKVPSGDADPLPAELLLRRQRRPSHIQPHLAPW